MSLSLTFQMAFAALLVERFAGYPAFLQRRIGHPVQWIGGLLSFIDQGIHRSSSARFIDVAKGVFAIMVVLAFVIIITVPVAWGLRSLPYGWAAEALLATTFLAQNDLRRFVLAVADGLDRGIDEGRLAVSHIVGRDTATLDESGVVRAASRVSPKIPPMASSRRRSGYVCSACPALLCTKPSIPPTA